MRINEQFITSTSTIRSFKQKWNGKSHAQSNVIKNVL